MRTSRSSFSKLQGASFKALASLSLFFVFFVIFKLSRISGLQKGPVERGHVKKRQKSSKSVKKFFDTFRHFSRRAKNVKNRQKVSKHFSTLFDNLRAAPFFRPLLQSADRNVLGCFGVFSVLSKVYSGFRMEKNPWSLQSFPWSKSRYSKYDFFIHV